ncbi:MAG TPA: DUF222 domain-containing protein [Marmoricola sp.]|nr:DUF222 domain-containing protein [Marmoricola sp.]
MSSSGCSVSELPHRPDMAGWMAALQLQDGAGLSDAERIDAVRRLEELKAAAAAAQARVTSTFDASQREHARPLLRQDPRRLSRSISAQVGLARRESPTRGQQHLGVALALVRDLPHTHAALSRGEISEWRATLVVRETACLAREDRRAVDRELAQRTEGGFLTGWGDRKIADAARAIGYRLDPGAALRRTSKAESERRVSIRPAPDTMANVTGLLPAAQGVAAYASLRKHAEHVRNQGDHRSLDQIMADTFVARLTGADDASTPPAPRVEIGLVMPERSLLRGSHEPAHLTGYGPVPATFARQLVRTSDKAWLRRLYTAPATGELVAMDSRRRTFRGKLRDLLVLRDRTCRTPWCDAPIRHADHVRAARLGGPTGRANGQGLCEACNYAKADPGWRADVIALPGRSVVELTTPTGHRHRSLPPAQPGSDPPANPEQQLRRLLDDTG